MGRGSRLPRRMGEAPMKREKRSRSSRHDPAEVRLGDSFTNKARGEKVTAGWLAWLSGGVRYTLREIFQLMDPSQIRAQRTATSCADNLRLMAKQVFEF